MTPQSAKAKGRALQQAVVALVLRLFPSLDCTDVRSCAMGSHGADVQLSQAARKLFGYAVECKSRASFIAYGWLDQAAAHGSARRWWS